MSPQHIQEAYISVGINEFAYLTDAHKNIYATCEENKIKWPAQRSHVSFLFQLISTPCFIYDIEKLLLFCTASVPMPRLFLHGDFASVPLKE